MITWFEYLLSFVSRFSFTNIHESQGCRRKDRATPHYYFHPLHRHLNIGWVIIEDSSLFHIASRWTQIGNLWLLSISSLPLRYVPLKLRVLFSLVTNLMSRCFLTLSMVLPKFELFISLKKSFLKSFFALYS